MPRVRGEGAARIDYRHVIWSLVTKPGAFARYRYRGQLFPTLAFRRAYGRSGAMRDPPVCSFKGALLADYVAYLTEVRGLVATTVSGHLGTASRFLASLGDDQLAFRLSTLSPYDLEVFVRSAGQRYGRDTLSHVVANLRCFLCFLGIRGLAPARLDSHVDSPRTYRRERLPRSLPWETVRALLQSIDRRDAKGVRDHAMLLLIATYGLRCCEIAGLALDDLDWRQRRIRAESRLATTFLASVGRDDRRATMAARSASALAQTIRMTSTSALSSPV
jgi:site-specific recombinase XerC